MGYFIKTAAFAAGLGAILATPAMAVPIYEASIDAVLSLTSATVSEGDGELDFEIIGESLLIDAGALFEDDATGGYSETLSPLSPAPMTEEPIVIQLSGSGAAPGIGYAESFALADSIVTIFNFSTTNTIRLDFALQINLTALTQVDDALFQFATSSTFFSLQSSQDFDPIVEFDFLADSDTADIEFSVSDLLIFTLFIAPESEASLFLLSDIFGSVVSGLAAPAEVPLPSMAGMFVLSALGLGLKSRRRKQH